MKKIALAALFATLALGAWANGTPEATTKPIVAVWYPNNSGEIGRAHV